MKKFRVWDRQENRWVEEFREILLDREGRVYEFDGGAFGDGLIQLNPDRYVIQFSTGLTYEDGTEKFEGDVVEVNAWAGANRDRELETNEHDFAFLDGYDAGLRAAQQWVSVKDRLPGEGLYFVTIEFLVGDEKHYYSGASNYRKGEWQQYDGVVAWMRIPEPFIPDYVEGGNQ